MSKGGPVNFRCRSERQLGTARRGEADLVAGSLGNLQRAQRDGAGGVVVVFVVAINGTITG